MIMIIQVIFDFELFLIVVSSDCVKNIVSYLFVIFLH